MEGFDINSIGKARRYMMFNLSVFDCLTEEERVLYNSYKKANEKDRDIYRKLFNERIESFSGIRTIEESKIYMGDKTPRLNKIITGFENEAVRLCESLQYDENNPKQIPLIKEFLILDCSNEIIMNQIIDRGINLAGLNYFMYSSSTNQQKKKQICLMESEFYVKNKSRLMCGLTIDIINNHGGCNTGKYLAYMSLVFSKSITLAEPINIDEVLVLPEFETMVMGTVNYLDMDKQIVEKKNMLVPVNHMDGAGMFLPGLLPSSAQIRGGYIKGCVFPFDFRQFIIEKQKSGKILQGATIKDAWGQEVSIDFIRDHIKLVLNCSQLKMYKYYNSWDEYKTAFKNNNLEICINNTLHYPKTDNPIVASAYQFFQTIPRKNITDQKIENLCKRSVEIINDYKTDSQSVLEIMGIDDEEEELEPFYATIKKYPEMVYDPYVRSRVAKKIANIRKMGMSGKPFIQGFYNYICPDLYAACEHWFCGAENPIGLIPKSHVYNAFYNDKDIEEVCCLRSPHLSDCEHGIRQLIKEDGCKKWFNGLDTVISSHDLLTKTLQADVDGDETLITHDRAFIDLVNREKIPLYYEMGKADPKEVNKANIKECLHYSFNNAKIGLISNALTKYWNMETEPDTTFAQILTAFNNFCIDYPKSLYMPVLTNEYMKMFDDLLEEKFPYFFQYAKGKKSKLCNTYNGEDEKSNVNRISKYIMQQTRNDKDNIWKKNDNASQFNPQHLQTLDFEVNRNSEEYKALQVKLLELKHLNNAKFRERLNDMYLNTISRNKLGFESFYFYCNQQILGIFQNDTGCIDIRKKATAYLLDIEYYQEENVLSNKEILWNCFGDILYDNLLKNIKGLEKGCKIKVKKLAYQKRHELNIKIENMISSSVKEMNEKYSVPITESEFKYICSIPCRKNCQKDVYLLYIIMVLYKRKMSYLESLEEQDTITKENRSYFKIYKDKKYGKITRATIDGWLGNISIAKKGLLRFQEKRLIDIVEGGDHDKIYPKFINRIDKSDSEIFKVTNWNPMFDYFQYTGEAVIGKCKICEKPFVVIGNSKTCSDSCSRMLRLRNKNKLVS